MMPYLGQIIWPVSEPIVKCHTCTVTSGPSYSSQSVSLFLYSWRGWLSRVVEPLGVKFSFRKELLYFSSNVFMNDIYIFFYSLVSLYLILEFQCCSAALCFMFDQGVFDLIYSPQDCLSVHLCAVLHGYTRHMCTCLYSVCK